MTKKKEKTRIGSLTGRERDKSEEGFVLMNLNMSVSDVKKLTELVTVAKVNRSKYIRDIIRNKYEEYKK